MNKGKLYCIYCAVSFPTPTHLAEHFLIFHSYQSSLLGLNPPDQPTDLSVARKTSPLKRTAPNDQQTASQKKHKFNENLNVSRNSSTLLLLSTIPNLLNLIIGFLFAALLHRLSSPVNL